MPPTPLKLLICPLVALIGAAAAAEDLVIVRGKPPQARVQKRGEIVDWIGGQLRLRGALDREESISSERIVDVQAARTEQQLAAQRLWREGQLAEAITAFYAAKGAESRAWVVRQISADLTVALLETDQPHLAGDEFLTITTTDPSTHLFDAIPLAWRSGSADAEVTGKARGWLNQDSPTAQLLGASWLLTSVERADAIAALERLRTHADRRLAAAAEIQLWRTRLVTVRPEEVARWQAAADRVPAELRGVAWYQIGAALARLNQPEDAALAYLQTALTYHRQRAMAADALAAAAGQLEKLNRRSEAAELYREVLRDYYSPAVRTAAETKLKALAQP